MLSRSDLKFASLRLTVLSTDVRLVMSSPITLSRSASEFVSDEVLEINVEMLPSSPWKILMIWSARLLTSVAES